MAASVNYDRGEWDALENGEAHTAIEQPPANGRRCICGRRALLPEKQARA
jgi:hypothetical protein